MNEATELAVRGDERMLPQGMILPSDEEIAKMYRLATAFYKSGVYKDLRQAEQAFAKLLVGRDLGLNITQSMQGIQFVQGQIQLHYSLLALIMRTRGFSWEKLERSKTRAAAKFFDPEGNERDEVEFTLEDAEAAGLTKPSPRSGEPSMYTKYPRNMLWARMMSDAVRFVIPEATGGVPVYVPGEVPPVAELTEGEGTGEARGIELPPEVEEVIARAENAGHAGWSERTAWEYRVDREAKTPGVVAASVREATADLGDLEKRQYEDVEVVGPDVPIEDADLPEPANDEVLERAREDLRIANEAKRNAEARGKALRSSEGEEQAWAADEPDSPTATAPVPSAADGSAEGESAARGTEEEPINVEALRHRLSVLQKKKPKTPEEERRLDEEVEQVEAQLRRAAEREARDDPNQESLM